MLDYEEPSDSSLIATVLKPKMLPEKPTLITFEMKALKQGKTFVVGVAKMVNATNIAYPIVIRAFKKTPSPSGAESKGDFHVTIEGITFAQAQQMRFLVQRREPHVLGFVGTVNDPISAPRLTQGFVAFHVKPIRQENVLYANGAFRPYGAVELIDGSGKICTVTIRGVGRLNKENLEVSPSDDFLVKVDTITLEQATTIQRIRQYIGPEGSTGIATILDAESLVERSNSIDLVVEILHYGLLQVGKAEIVHKEGQPHPIDITRMKRIDSAKPDLLKRQYVFSVEGISPEQAHDMQTIIQEF